LPQAKIMCTVRLSLTPTRTAAAALDTWKLRVAALATVCVAGAYPILIRFAHAIAARHAVSSALELCERVAVASLLMFVTPAMGLWLVLRLSQSASTTLGEARLRAVATLVMSAPPLFTLIGVECWLAGMPNLENAVWLAIWLPLAVVAWRSAGERSQLVSRRLPGASWRIAHGMTALLLLVGIIGLHISNHVVGLVSAEMHLRVMHALRRWYRAASVEPWLILLVVLQIGTGAMLARRWLARSVDGARALQAATGAYLGLYLVCHLNSVFVYARANGVDTDFWFASGGRAGLVADTWNTRLVPHYALAVLFLLVHVAAGMRVVLRGHGHESAWLMPTAWFSGVLVACGAVLPLVRVQLG
jgi:hypothetical protein